MLLLHLRLYNFSHGPEVGGLLPITSQKNNSSEGKKLLVDIPSGSDKRVTYYSQ